MAEDLMDFGASPSVTEKYVDTQDENEGIPLAPGLVQSPVIVNSILKQSTKDNLIQLYTPIQKAEKGRLKVHFGHDSLLQTPNVKTAKKKTDARGIRFNDIAESPTKQEPKVPEKSVENVEFVSVLVNDIVDSVPTQSEETKGDNFHTENVEACAKPVEEIPTSNNADESAMDISVCDAPPSMENEEPAAFDLLEQAQLLLQSLNSEVMEEVKPEPTETEKPEVPNVTESVKETGGSSDKVLKVTEAEVNVDGSAVGANTYKEGQHVISDLDSAEEAMEVEEEMEVDDEIVFNLPVGTKQADISCHGDERIQKVQIEDIPLKNENDDQPTVNSEEIKKESDAAKDVPCDNTSKSNVEEAEKDELSTSLNGLVNNDIESVQEVPEDALSTSLNGFVKSDGETAGEVVELKQNVVEQSVPAEVSVVVSGDTNVTHDEVTAAVTIPTVQENTSDKKGSSKSREDSSDDEFMSADEDMEVDEIKTPLKSVAEVSNVEQNVSENKEESPERIPPKVGYNLDFDDLEAMDPFSTKKSIMNSPDLAKAKQAPALVVEKAPLSDNQTELNETSETEKPNAAENNEQTLPVPESPKLRNTPKSELLLSPNAVLVDKVCQDKNAGDIFDEKPECVLKDTEVIENINFDDMPLKGSSGNINFDDMPLKGSSGPVDFSSCTEADLENLDPFKSKLQVCNTPDRVKVEQPESDTGDKLSEGSSIDVAENPKEKPVTEKVASSEVKCSEVESKVPDIDNTSEEKNDDETEVSSKVIENSEGTDSQAVPVTKPVKEAVPEVTEIPTSPAIPMSKGVYDLDALDLDAIDPFKPKQQMVNSPCSKTETVKSDLDDPFKPKVQIMNSPVVKAMSKSENKSDSEPVKMPDTAVQPNVESGNKPSVNAGLELAKEPEQANIIDQVPVNDKPSENASSETVSKEVGNVNDSDKNTEKDQNTKVEADVKESAKVAGEPTGTVNADLFADLNPFTTNSKVANTPEKVQEKFEEKEMSFDEINPFGTKSKIGNSPVVKDNPFETKPCIANTPVKDNESMKVKDDITKSLPEGFSVGIDESNDIFEVQGVTRRGEEDLSQMNQFGDVDETQFVSASQVFNDPGVWEMLENIGTTKDTTSESALSRMSLYVKFDPLVDAAPINPRRVSIRFSQLEKVKEYGIDDTLLLLGTPPKKRRQSVTAAQAKVTPAGARTTPAPATSLFGKDTEPANSEPAAVDLIFAYSPKEKKEQKEEESMVQKEDIAMCLMDEAAMSEESDNLFQELKYTDADLKKIRMEMKLSLQGTLMNKEKEWCHKYKQLENEKVKLLEKLKRKDKEASDFQKVYLCLEKTVEEIMAKHDAAKRKIDEVTLERNQAMEDIQSVESAFSILNGRYDKSKTMIQSMMKNDEVVKKYAADLQEKLKQQNEKYQTLEKTSKQKISESSQMIEKLKNQEQTTQERSKAQLKLLQMKIDSLEKRIETKVEENKQLTEICDNLLANVGEDK